MAVSKIKFRFFQPRRPDRAATARRPLARRSAGCKKAAQFPNAAPVACAGAATPARGARALRADVLPANCPEILFTLLALVLSHWYAAAYRTPSAGATRLARDVLEGY